MRTAVLLLLATMTAAGAAQRPNIVADVRLAIAQQNFAGGERMVAAYRQLHGTPPELLEALSWLARGALAARQLEPAEYYASQTYTLATAQLESRPLDREAHLPIALGASIEVLAQVTAGQGARTEAVIFLRRELERYRGTSIEKRIQKNILLLSLEGKRAPPLDVSEYLGVRPPVLERLEGKVVLLFFWAHWCADCKAEAPMLGRLVAKYRDRGLVVVAPTQRFGYAEAGRPVGPEEELRYIDRVRLSTYPMLADVAIPTSVDNHTRYGVSSTPTIVLVDRGGVVRLYNPGRVGEEKLDALLARLLTQPPR